MRSAPRGTTGPIERFGCPGMTLTTVPGKRRWNCPRVDLAVASYDASASVSRRPELAREPAPRLEPVGVGRHVDRLREARVRDRAVVALEEVLDAHLPVAGVLGRLGPLVERERVDVDALRRRAARAARRGASASGAASGSGLTNTNGPHVSTATGTSPRASRSKPGSRSARGALRSAPSRPYVHAWYGHWIVSRRASPSQRTWPRCRQTLTKPRSSPSRRARQDDGQRRRPGRSVSCPGSATWSRRPAYCQVRAKIRSCSSRSTAGSAYQSYGSVRVTAAVATWPIYRPTARISAGLGSSDR